MTSITEATRKKIKAMADLDLLTKGYEREKESLLRMINDCQTSIALSAASLDVGRIENAERIIYATDPAEGGLEAKSCIRDAINQLASGKQISVNVDLWQRYFATKNYDRWQGQRSDHEYGMGPRHGSICFKIGLTREALSRGQSGLLAEEVEDALYYLSNLENVHRIRKSVTAVK